MLRYYIKFTYNYDPVEDSEYYKYAAETLLPFLMRYNGNNYNKICISANSELSINDLKTIVKYLWESFMPFCVGSYNGFEYKRLRPESFLVNIERVTERDIIETSRSICKLSDKIIECFTECDARNIMVVYDEWKINIEKQIKTIADCLSV